MGHEWLTRNGYTLISAASPTQFLDEGPHSMLYRQLLGSIVAFQRSEMTQRLRAAREAKMATTASRTLAGKPKVAGRKSALDEKHGVAIKRVLKPFVSKPRLEKGDLTCAHAALVKKGLRTGSGEEFSMGQVLTWLTALRTAASV